MPVPGFWFGRSYRHYITENLVDPNGSERGFSPLALLLDPLLQSGLRRRRRVTPLVLPLLVGRRRQLGLVRVVLTQIFREPQDGLGRPLVGKCCHPWQEDWCQILLNIVVYLPVAEYRAHDHYKRSEQVNSLFLRQKHLKNKPTRFFFKTSNHRPSLSQFDAG